MSSDYFDALGLVRTEELIAADRYYGTQQFWTRVIDYGFSKTREEALEKWGHDRVLSDAVRVVRMPVPRDHLRFCRRAHGRPRDHQVAGQVAQEVFKAAGDPNMFPEQIKEGLRPWKAAQGLRPCAIRPYHRQRNLRLRRWKILSSGVSKLYG